MFQPLLRIAAIAAIATPAMAQWLPYGTQIMDGSQNLVTVNLGFNFTMPGGNVVTAVDVDETGRVFEVGIDTTDASESTAEMSSNLGGSINVLWDTITYTASENSSVWFNTDNSSVATVTWYEVNTTTNTTFQLQMYASGEIYMLYDSRNPEDDGIIGVCPGNGAVIPAQSDLSTAIGSSIVTTDPTIFEDFGFTAGVDAVDFVSTLLIWTPNGVGGVNGWTVAGIGGIPDPAPVAFAINEDLGGAGCVSGYTGGFVQASYTFTPDGLGNYDITSGPSQFDAAIGPATAQTADLTIQITNLDLGFVFPFPGGVSDQFVRVDPKGRVMPESLTAGETIGDWTPTVGELTGDGFPMILPLWSDWNVSEPGSGTIHFVQTIPGVSATFTWNGVKQYDTADLSVPVTFQLVMFSDGSFVITHEDIGGFNASGDDDLMMGCGTGALPDPGEIDFTALGAGINVPSGNNYEFWDASGFNEPTDLLDFIPPYEADLVALTAPLIGANWELEIQNSGASLFGFYLIGFTPVSVDLTVFGSPCNLLVNQVELVTTFTTGGGSMLPYVLPLPNDPLLNGAELFIQGAIEGAPQPPFSGFVGLPWAFSFTNAIRGVVGEY